VAIAAAIFPRLTALLTVEFLREWAGLVRLRFIPFDPETIREAIASGAAAFGIGLQTDAADAETIEPSSIDWSILVPSHHGLAAISGPVTSDRLSGELICLTPEATRARGIGEFLSQVPPANRIEAPSSTTARAIVESGQAIALDLDFGNDHLTQSASLRRLPVVGLECERVVLVLPRRDGALSEPTKFLVDVVREVVRNLTLPLPTPIEEPSIESLPEIPPLPAKPFPA
jgi:DNA-binding transcriptional LysR family regulator